MEKRKIEVTIGKTICRYTYNRPEIDEKVPDVFYKILVDEIRRKMRCQEN